MAKAYSHSVVLRWPRPSLWKHPLAAVSFLEPSEVGDYAGCLVPGENSWNSQDAAVYQDTFVQIGVCVYIYIYVECRWEKHIEI